MKRKISYAKEVTAAAKACEGAKATVSVVFPDGSRIDEQMAVTLEQARFLKWAAAAAFCEESRALPDLEGMLRRLMDES